ncbi:PREDICTED: aldehyde oxidase-like [Ceratotherium simum simum]|uniref:Aldehyde oxidase-like n=1 Tax=Ceratotherium simum simum TaxID=73337 RepID=A0ABM1CKM9_CERSS|nr:PREDICTED: aldehyde oxidase-like [Ceratotherium simum simum]
MGTARAGVQLGRSSWSSGAPGPKKLELEHAQASAQLSVIEKNVDPETMLLPYLRKKLRLTGTKYGCGGGGCGACTVMISRYNPITKKIRHYPANACLTPICSLHGAAVTTVEGIGSTKARIHPVQERIAKCHGTQCGFCTPGMVMSIYTLLRNHPEPTLDQLTDALGGNLCRCTGYRPIIDTCKTFCKTSGCCQSKENGVCCLDQGVNGVPGFEEGKKSLGGHIVSRHLDSDLNPLLAVGNCTLNLLSKEGERQIPLNEQFLKKCPRADLKPEEILVSVNIPYSRKWEFVSAFRQAQRQQNALAIVNSGMRVFFGEGDGIIRELSIAYGGVGPTTVCAKNSCQKLIGRPWNEEMLDAACRLVLDEVSLPGGAPGGQVEFKRTLIVSFLFKFYLKVSQTLKTMDPVHYPGLADKLPEKASESLASALGPNAVLRQSLDLSEALSLPGVVDIVTEEHLRGVNSFCFVTEPEKLLGTEEEAIQHNSFFEGEWKLECGNVDEAFKVVDQILEGEVHVGGQEHFYMETQSMLVVPKGEDQEIDVYVSTQFPKYVQLIVASTLKLPANKVMCHVKRLGGAFGGKSVKTGIMAAITAFAANKHGRAVRCILERGEDMLITAGRHPYLGKYKAGFLKDGRILALDVEHYSNGGTSLDESLLVMEQGVLKVENAYKFPNLRCRARACRTNLPSNTALRGFGFPQAGLITESCITEVAARCGLSPEKVRTINMYNEIDQTPYKQEINAKNLIQCWKECMAKSSYSLRKAAVEKFNSENYWKKKGLAIIPLKFPQRPWDTVLPVRAPILAEYNEVPYSGAQEQPSQLASPGI